MSLRHKVRKLLNPFAESPQLVKMFEDLFTYSHSRAGRWCTIKVEDHAIVVYQNSPRQRLASFGPGPTAELITIWTEPDRLGTQPQVITISEAEKELAALKRLGPRSR